VINTWDLVPAFPAVKNGFALNQGGIVLPLPNYYTQGCVDAANKASFTSEDAVPKSGVFPRTAPEAAERAMCAGEVRARSPCHSPRCEKTHKAAQDEFGKSMSTHHDAILQVEPPMFMLMEAVRAREMAGAAVPVCKQDATKHQIHTFMTSGLPKGNDGESVFEAWKAHVMKECDRETWSAAKEKARGFKHNHHCDFVRAEHGFSTFQNQQLPKGVCDDGFSDKEKYKMNERGNIVLTARAMTHGQAQLSASTGASFLQTAKTQQACPSGSKHQFKCEDGACVMSQADCKSMTALANKAGPIIDSVQKGLRAV
jgi:hypothetical protein